MKKSSFYKVAAFSALLLTGSSAMAWDHGVSIGYGGGSDMNHHTDTNTGVFLSSDIKSLMERNWTHITLNASLGSFHSSWSANKDLFTAALSLAFRFYLFNTTNVHPYFFASAGPSYLSNTAFGRNYQADNFAFQSILGLGTEVGKAKRIDLSLKFIHYSNAYTMQPNQGYNIFYIGSIGYLF